MASVVEHCPCPTVTLYEPAAFTVMLDALLPVLQT